MQSRANVFVEQRSLLSNRIRDSKVPVTLCPRLWKGRPTKKSSTCLAEVWRCTDQREGKRADRTKEGQNDYYRGASSATRLSSDKNVSSMIFRLGVYRISLVPSHRHLTLRTPCVFFLPSSRGCFLGA